MWEMNNSQNIVLSCVRWQAGGLLRCAPMAGFRIQLEKRPSQRMDQDPGQEQFARPVKEK